MTSAGRKLRRLRYKERMKEMRIKRKAIQIELSDGRKGAGITPHSIVLQDGHCTVCGSTVVTVHAPSMEQFTEFMASFGILEKIGKAFQAVQDFGNGIGYNLGAVKLDKQTVEEFYPLLAALSDISIEDFKELPVEDGMSIMMAYVTLLSPASLNPTEAAAEQIPSPAPQPQS